MFVLLPSYKLTEIQQLLLLLVTEANHYSPSGYVLSGKITFSASGHVQLCQMCHVLWSNILNAYHSSANLFLSHYLSFLVQCQLQELSHLQQNLGPL